MKLTVVLGAAGEASFDIELNDNPFVRKWIKELQWCLDNCSINQQEAFAGLLTLHEAEQILNNACITINKYLKNFIEIRPDFVSQPQDYFNYLHQKFEQLSGEFGKPTKLFSIANQELKDAIRNLNFYIHRIETKKSINNNLYLSLNKDQYRRHSLAEEDYKYFEFKLPPGTLILHYVELGKDFSDLYQDNLSVTYANFKNLHFYSGEASLILNEFDCFEDNGYVEWLKLNNIDPLDKKLGHGKIPLGKVCNPAAVGSLIQQYRHIKNIIIKE
jgi:hypothetical protein